MKPKTVLVDGKPVVFMNNRKTVPPLGYIKKVYRQVPDSKNIPAVFMTRKQYIEQYIANQEKANGVKFTPAEKRQYIQQETKDYKRYASRYTTKQNPYYPPAVVFFNDKRISKKEFKDEVHHEYGHEYAEKHNLKLQDEEHFADNYKRLKKKVQQPQSVSEKILGKILKW